jgi:hypothetical protein
MRFLFPPLYRDAEHMVKGFGTIAPKSIFEEVVPESTKRGVDKPLPALSTALH